MDVEVADKVRARLQSAGWPDFAAGLPLEGVSVPTRPAWLVGRDATEASSIDLTIALFTRNGLEGVRLCLASLQEQTYPRITVLVIDNAPTNDRVRKFVETAHCKVPVHYVVEPTPGLSYACNRAAVGLCQTELIAFIDDDEVACPYWASEVVRGFVEDPSVDCVTGVVTPSQLNTAAQQLFERYGGHSKGRGFRAGTFDGRQMGKNAPLSPLYIRLALDRSQSGQGARRNSTNRPGGESPGMRLFGRRISVHVQEDSPWRVVPIPSGALGELTAAVLVAVGAALVVWAYRVAPTARIQSYDPIFWAGMLLAYLAVAWRAVSGRHVVLWLGLLGLFTVLPWFLMNAGGPSGFDETAHVALLRNVISAGRLFQYSPLLPIGTFYPGLESAAATIHWLTGLSPWDSALTLIAVVHCLLPVQVYYLARALRVPGRWAAAAGVVYAANPSFVYFDVQFSYESVAILLMLTIVRLYVEALAAERSGGPTWRQSLSASLLIAVISFGLVVTHHLTSMVGIALLLAGALFLKPIRGLADRKGGWRRLFIRWMPVLTLAMCLGLWIVFVAPITVGYLFPHVSGTVSEVVALATRSKASRGAARTPFSGSGVPSYEEAAAIAAPIMIAVAFLFAGIRWLQKPPLRLNFLWSFVVTAGYLASLPVTLTSDGAESAHRTWAFTFVGVAFLPAALVILFELDKRRPWLKRTAATVGAAVLAVVLVGNVAVGAAPDARFPGPYQFGSDTRSVTPETLRFADWVQAHLGPGANVVTDRFTALALTAHADAVTPLPENSLPIANIWYNPGPPTPALISAMELSGDDYLAVDVRDAQYTATGSDPALFYPGEPTRVPLQNITRLAQWPWLRLLYSSQHYRLYKIDFLSYFLWYAAHANDH